MTTAIFLTTVGLLSRFIPHPPNAVPLGAIALYAGARLPRRMALLIPVLVLFVSDVVINLGLGYPFYPASQLTTYATFMAVAALGSLLPKDAGVPARMGMSVVASTVFFLVSNFAVWVEGSGYGLPHTLPGLVSNYVLGLAFYRNSLLADLIGTASLFALDGLLGRVASRFAAAQRPVVLTGDES